MKRSLLCLLRWMGVLWGLIGMGCEKGESCASPCEEADRMVIEGRGEERADVVFDD